jgi:3-deoxy-manno-octulosonate cytidylyltransferase (CMP-KDO synthetase)
VSGFGGTAMMTHRDHASGTDRIAEVAAALTSELVVNLQGDLPFIVPEPIDAVVALLRHDPSLVMGTLRREITDPAELARPSVVKVVVDASGRALYFSRAAIPFARDAESTVRRWKHLGLYVYRRAFLLEFATLRPTPLERAEQLEQLRALEHGFAIGTVATSIDTVEIDTPEDLDRARALSAESLRS